MIVFREVLAWILPHPLNYSLDKRRKLVVNLTCHTPELVRENSMQASYSSGSSLFSRAYNVETTGAITGLIESS